MSRSGEYRDNLSGELAYQSFNPAPLPPAPALDLDDQFFADLAQAKALFAQLNAAVRYIPNVELFISMYVYKEALITSQIEGTQCTIEDIFDPSVQANTNRDLRDVLNYHEAVQFALDRMQELPLSNRLLREAHAYLLQDARGEEQQPGEFRRSQNWVGPAGATLADARYVPPNVEDMQQALSDLERYINENKDYDALIQAALIHYQFETIHPFLDGNGRMGRLLILLYLIHAEVLSAPIFYPSYALKKNQSEYYDRLMFVREQGNYEQWVRFFVNAMADSAQNALDSIEQLQTLHEKNQAKLPVSSRRQDSLATLFAFIEEQPIIEIGKTAEVLGFSYNTIAKAVETLVDLGILKQTNSGSRNRIFAYTDYLAILSPGTEG